MPRRTKYDESAVRDLLRRQERIATHDQLARLGMPRSTITHRILPSGPWQRILPGVVAAHSGTVTQRERLLGAIHYAGPGAVVTGRAGLRLHGRRTTDLRGGEVPHILIRHERRRNAHHFAVIERTRHMPTPVLLAGVQVAPQTRCLVDASRRQEHVDDVRGLVAECVQSGGVSPRALAEALNQANRQRTAGMRLALAEIDAGVRGVAEARVAELVERSSLPQAMFNAVLFRPDGTPIGCLDGYFQHCAAGYEIDSFAYHFRRSLYTKTQRRQRRVLRENVLLMGISPVDAYENPDAFIQELGDLIHVAEQRTPPDLIVCHRDEVPEGIPLRDLVPS
ncbi:MAG: hypothetical protein M3419_11015 [Actinomycetota bacterium]|nr:hypothetical protein [Actinomycetota bacterium]